MTKRTVLAPAPDSLSARLVDSRVGDIVIFESYGVDVLTLRSEEARHLARWLRDNGFLDERGQCNVCNAADGRCQYCAPEDR